MLFCSSVERIVSSGDEFQLNKEQIHCLITQINLVNWISLTTTLSSEKQQSWLILYLVQLIELLHRLRFDLDQLPEHETIAEKSLSVDIAKIKFALSPVQILHLINQHKFDIQKLISVEENLKSQDLHTRQFRLNSSQIAYLIAHHRTSNNDMIPNGLSASQLIGIYALRQKMTQDDQSKLLSFGYQQIQRLAMIQSK